MSFILIDKDDEHHDLQINGWHWRTILAILSRCEALSQETIHFMGIGCIGTECSEVEVRQIAAVLRNKILPNLEADDRVLYDGTITKEPKDLTLHIGTNDWSNYSTDRKVIQMVCEFCETAKGMKIS